MTTETPTGKRKLLLPCPFCGGKPEITSSINDTQYNHWRVSCVRCLSRTWTQPHKHLAVAVWNRRSGA